MGLVKRTYVDGETVITADNLNDIQDEIIQNASDISTKGTYSKPSGGIPASDLASGVQTSLGKADTAYQKPSGGIPSTDMASAVQTSLGKADSAYQKPSGGIPSTDLASAVQTSLEKADTALQSSDIDSTLTVTGKAADAKKTGDEISGVKNTLNQFVRPNLLDNWYFVGGGSQAGDGHFPINQRGLTVYEHSQAYTIDRWYCNNVKLTIPDATGVTLISSGIYQTLLQRIANGIALLSGKQCTASILYGSNSLQSFTFTWPSTSEAWLGYVGSTGFYMSAQSPSGTSYASLNVVAGTGDPISINIKAIKLELGSGQTLAHQENGQWVLNEIPNYDEQMLRCCSSKADSGDTYANKPYNELKDSVSMLKGGYKGTVTNTDLNTLTATGQYRIYQGCTNMPPNVSDDVILVVFNSFNESNSYCLQLAANASNFWERFYFYGYWSEWHKIAFA